MDFSVLPHHPDIFPVPHTPNLAVNNPSSLAEAKAPLAHLRGLWGGGLEFMLDQPVAKQQQKEKEPKQGRLIADQPSRQCSYGA